MSIQCKRNMTVKKIALTRKHLLYSYEKRILGNWINIHKNIQSFIYNKILFFISIVTFYRFFEQATSRFTTGDSHFLLILTCSCSNNTRESSRRVILVVFHVSQYTTITKYWRGFSVSAGFLCFRESSTYILNGLNVQGDCPNRNAFTFLVVSSSRFKPDLALLGTWRCFFTDSQICVLLLSILCIRTFIDFSFSELLVNTFGYALQGFLNFLTMFDIFFTGFLTLCTKLMFCIRLKCSLFPYLKHFRRSSVRFLPRYFRNYLLSKIQGYFDTKLEFRTCKT